MKRRIRTFDGLVEATVFEPQELAYEPTDAYVKNRGLIGIALPGKLTEKQRKALRVWVGYNGRQVDNVPIVDVGPWNVSDYYFLRDHRPLVEELKSAGRPADNGQVPTNEAAVDLTWGLAEKLGFPGKGDIRLMVEVVDPEPFLAEGCELVDSSASRDGGAPRPELTRDSRGRLRQGPAYVCDWCGSLHRRYLVYLPEIDYEEHSVEARWVCRRCAEKLIGRAALRAVFGRGIAPLMEALFHALRGWFR